MAYPSNTALYIIFHFSFLVRITGKCCVSLVIHVITVGLPVHLVSTTGGFYLLLFLPSCPVMDQKFMSPSNAYAEALTPNVTVT